MVHYRDYRGRVVTNVVRTCDPTPLLYIFGNKICLNYRDVVQKISYLQLWRPSCSVERNHLCKIERGHHGEHSCEVICNLDQWFRRKCPLKKKFTDGRMHDGQRTKTNHNF